MDQPMKDGTMCGQIETSMNSVNIGRKNDPKTHSYKGTMDLNAAGGGKIATSNSIMGPGMKGAYPNKGMGKK